MNYLKLFVWKKVFILSLLFKNIFTTCRILGWHFFPSTLDVIPISSGLHYFWQKKSVVHLIFVLLLYIMCLFSSLRFSLSHWFSSIRIWCTLMWYLFILFGVFYWPSWISRFIFFNKFGKILTFLLIISWSHSLFVTLTANKLDHLMLSYQSLSSFLFQPFFCLLLLREFLYYVFNFTDFFLSVVSNLQLSPFDDFFSL